MRIALSAVTGTTGGPRTYALALLRALQALDGPEDYVLLADRPASDEETGGAPWCAVPMPGGTAVRPLSEAFALPLAVRRSGADVVHATKQSLPRGLGRPTVVTIHDLAPHLLPETFSRAAGIYLRHATEAAARRADHIVAVSENTAKDVREHLGVAPDRITVVHNGVDDRFRSAQGADRVVAARERHAVPERYLLCVGTIQPRKNVDIVLDALELLAARGAEVPPLVLAGRAAWMSEDVLARAKGSPHVIHLGEVGDADLLALYAGATIFVSPSSYEGFGLVVAEAMAAGVAVIGGAGSATDEVVGDAGVLVPPRDAGALAEAITGLLSDDARRAALAAAGRERSARFTWDAAARATREVYRRVGEAS